MFNGVSASSSSLLNLAEDFEIEYDHSISKQGLHERFNDQAVAFLKEVLSSSLSLSYRSESLIEDSPFASCQIRDSTRFALPDEYANVYPGHGGVCNSLLSIQHEIDLLTGECLDLQITSGRRNDQKDTRESSKNLLPNSLLIRDLGYITTCFLKSVINQKAYFLNRLPSQMQVFDQAQQAQLINFDKVLKKMKRYSLHYMEFNILAGKKARIPCRLVVYLNDKKTAKNRLFRTTKNTNSLGCKVSEEQKTRSQLDIYITNVDQQVIKSENVRKVYSLRWQMELVFKTWKSLYGINKMKKVKIQRFQCLLLATMIWVVLHWRVFEVIYQWAAKEYPEKAISLWKYFNYAKIRQQFFRNVVFKNHDPYDKLKKLLKMTEKKFIKETKKGKQPYYQLLKLVSTS